MYVMNRRTIEIGDVLDEQQIPDQVLSYLPDKPAEGLSVDRLVRPSELARYFIDQVEERRDNVLKSEQDDPAQLALKYAIVRLMELPEDLYIDLVD